jgi:hypothetical protein
LHTLHGAHCAAFAAMAVLPLAARCGAMAQTYPQRKIQTSILEVPGARIYYETHGRGPVMLMVPGASGTAESSSGVVSRQMFRDVVRRFYVRNPFGKLINILQHE